MTKLIRWAIIQVALICMCILLLNVYATIRGPLQSEYTIAQLNGDVSEYITALLIVNDYIPKALKGLTVVLSLLIFPYQIVYQYLKNKRKKGGVNA